MIALTLLSMVSATAQTSGNHLAGSASPYLKRASGQPVDWYSLHFIVVDLDIPRSPEQQKLVKQFYKGYIPHVVVLNASGEALFNQSGEIDSERIEEAFKSSINR